MNKPPCCIVAFSGSDRFPKGGTFYIEWLPKGHGPSEGDRLVCAFPSPDDGRWKKYGLRQGTRPPLIEAIVRTIEAHLRDHPEDAP